MIVVDFPNSQLQQTGRKVLEDRVMRAQEEHLFGS